MLSSATLFEKRPSRGNQCGGRRWRSSAIIPTSRRGTRGVWCGSTRRLADVVEGCRPGPAAACTSRAFAGLAPYRRLADGVARERRGHLAADSRLPPARADRRGLSARCDPADAWRHVRPVAGQGGDAVGVSSEAVIFRPGTSISHPSARSRPPAEALCRKMTALPGHRSVDRGSLPDVLRRARRCLPDQAMSRCRPPSLPCALASQQRPQAESARRRWPWIWAPWRSVAARLFWAYYAAETGSRRSLPVG